MRPARAERRAAAVSGGSAGRAPQTEAGSGPIPALCTGPTPWRVHVTAYAEAPLACAGPAPGLQTRQEASPPASHVASPAPLSL